MIYHLEKEREKFGAEASDANAKFGAVLEEVKLREMTIVDLQKNIVEGDMRLKQQQNQYEAVRSDRNLYSKNLIESQARPRSHLPGSIRRDEPPRCSRAGSRPCDLGAISTASRRTRSPRSSASSRS